MTYAQRLNLETRRINAETRRMNQEMMKGLVKNIPISLQNLQKQEQQKNDFSLLALLGGIFLLSKHK